MVHICCELLRWSGLAIYTERALMQLKLTLEKDMKHGAKLLARRSNELSQPPLKFADSKYKKGDWPKLHSP